MMKFLLFEIKEEICKLYEFEIGWRILCRMKGEVYKHLWNLSLYNKTFSIDINWKGMKKSLVMMIQTNYEIFCVENTSEEGRNVWYKMMK